MADGKSLEWQEMGFVRYVQSSHGWPLLLVILLVSIYNHGSLVEIENRKQLESWPGPGITYLIKVKQDLS